jgi:adenylate cyclase
MSDLLQGTIDWLIDGARSAHAPQEVLAQLCTRLADCGVPLWRVRVFVRTLHPNLMGRRISWDVDKGVDVNETPIEVRSSEMFRLSPIAAIMTDGRPLRRRLLAPDCPMDFPVLEELRAEGATDYLIAPLNFIGGETHAVSWATRAIGGFSDSDIAALDAIMPPLTRVAEIWSMRRVATNLLDTYVGRQAGARILAGQIRRGHTEAITAAIWLSDLRDFTELSDRTPGPALIELLNRYFDCQVPPIQAHGGEVLKYTGDGLLAIFPIAGDERDATTVCNAALAAARAFRADLAQLNASDAQDGAPLRCGLALHVGDVMYGNIGGGNRLDFTAIGPAVNLSARLETLARDLNRTVIASGAFARNCQQEFVPLGARPLRGLAAPQEAFGLAEEGSVDAA